MEGPNPIFVGPLVTVGTFRCGPANALWHEPNCIGEGHHVVFPETPVRIAQWGQSPFVTSRNHVVLYDPQQEYSRSLVSDVGDRCIYLIIDEADVARILERVIGSPSVQFPRHHGALTSTAFLCSRQLLARALTVDAEPLAVEEAALDLVAMVLAEVLGRRVSRATLTERQLANVEAAKELLTNRFAERLGLADIGRVVGASPYHLTRSFRSATGYSLHDYVVQLRVRAAVDALRRGHRDLATLAVDLGFASHSHLTDSIRRAFGAPPSTLRLELAA